MYVVVWESSRGGGGHIAVMDRDKADSISRVLSRERPTDTIRVLLAADYGAAAVVEREARRSTRRRGTRAWGSD
jgi:hypothetical protein